MKSLLIICASLLGLAAGSATAGEIDHVIVAAPELDTAGAALARQTGISTAFGGVHVAGDTANRLAALGPGLYLELLGPAPGKTPFGKGARLAKLAAPTPDGFAIRVKDAEAEAARLTAAGVKVSPVQAGGRTTPEGVALHWKTFGVEAPEFCAVLPFFIEWSADTPHPSLTAPQGARLGRLRVFHPKAAELTRLYRTLGVPLKAEAGEAGLELTLKGPEGEARYAGAPDCSS